MRTERSFLKTFICIWVFTMLNVTGHTQEMVASVSKDCVDCGGKNSASTLKDQNIEKVSEYIYDEFYLELLCSTVVNWVEKSNNSSIPGTDVPLIEKMVYEYAGHDYLKLYNSGFNPQLIFSDYWNEHLWDKSCKKEWSPYMRLYGNADGSILRWIALSGNYKVFKRLTNPRMYGLKINHKEKDGLSLEEWLVSVINDDRYMVKKEILEDMLKILRENKKKATI
jgi:hypothetical protein